MENFKGRAHVVAFPWLIDKLRLHPRITILKESDFGDGTVICLIESDLIPETYRGVCYAVVEGDGFRFVRDADV